VRVVLAPDSFGETLTAVQAVAAMAEGWQRAAPGTELARRPMSDGGPGFLDVLASADPASGGTSRLLAIEVLEPLGRPTAAQLLLIGTTAYVESAQATGLHLLTEAERDPRVTSSAGVGVLLRAAVDAGARRVVVGLGGSATNDGGAGMLAALGAVPVDSTGLPLPPGGAALARVDRLDGPPRLAGVDLVAATDVDNPLLGISGATAVYGPQKGASRADVLVLDAALTRWAEILERDVPGAPANLRALPGAGAAGGLGAALLALGARRQSGIALVRDLVGLDAALEQADLVVTGEGAFDFSSLRGKVVAGVAAAAVERGLPCVVLAGQVAVGQREMRAAGVEAAYALLEVAGSVEAAKAEPARHLAALAARVARQWSRPPA